MARKVISPALNKVIEKSNEEGKKPIPCSFDVSWSHEGKNITTHEGNFDQSSNFDKYFRRNYSNFQKNNLLLDIAIDGDLDSNKTLSKYSIVNQIFTDLKHKTKTIRNKINNGKYKKCENFESAFLIIILHVYTASNQKENYNEKSIEEKKALPLPPDDDNLHYMQTEICEIGSFSIQDLKNIEKIHEQCDVKREESVNNINERNSKKHDQLNQLKYDMTGFNFDQDLIPYGLGVQEKLNNNEFLPSFHEYIYNFKSLIKCQNCLSFPKYSANGLCK
ncbi:1789_t:CDS:2, partial [Entrophospora sp. SA101]